MASGLMDITGGTLDVMEGNIGYVFQDATLLPWRTVQRNVELFTELHNLPKEERGARAKEAIAIGGHAHASVAGSKPHHESTSVPI
jgi:NitT/TauT family transport system ATP-binding protein